MGESYRWQETAILNGQQVGAVHINPIEHRFIGMWRSPTNPAATAKCDVLCACGQLLRFTATINEHYRNGCWDLPQYVNIEGSG